jgi:hypothetical protein
VAQVVELQALSSISTGGGSFLESSLLLLELFRVGSRHGYLLLKFSRSGFLTLHTLESGGKL